MKNDDDMRMANIMINRNNSCIWIFGVGYVISNELQINRNNSCIWIECVYEDYSLMLGLIETIVVFEYMKKYNS